MKTAFPNAGASLLAMVAVIGGTVAGTAVAPMAAAEAPGVAALLEQARYWRSKGRGDLANQALRRALALDPGSAAVRAAMARPTPAPAAAPPRAKPATAPRPSPAAPTATPAPSAARAPAAAQPRPAADTGGNARAAGFRSLDAGNLTEAGQHFQRAVSQNRRDGDALGGLGIVRLRQSRFAEARDLLEQASRLGNAAKWTEALESARFFGGLADARTALGRGRVAEAQTLAEAQVRSGFAQKGPALELLAEIYERQGRLAEAADLYRQAGGEAGEKANSRLQSRAARDRALQAAAAGNDALAEQEFVNGLMLDQRDPWIRYEFARFQIKRGRVAEVDSLLRSLTASSESDSLYAAALINAEMGRNGAADALITRIPEDQQTPQMRNFSLGLKIDNAVDQAKALAAQGRTADAIARLRQLAAMPGIPAAKIATIGDALYGLGDSAGAAQLAQQALSGEITDPSGYEAIVRVASKTGNDSLAMAAVQRATQVAGPSADGQVSVARMNGILAASQADRLRLGGQYASAFDMLQGAWTNAPGDAEVLSALARLYQSGGMPAQAAQTFQLVLKQLPQDKGAMMGLIETAGAAGDRGLANETIARALRIRPNDYEIYLAAARMEQTRGDEGAAVKYLKRAREAYSGANSAALTSANPFAATPQGNNPFRNQARAAAPPVNPFALGKGARLGGGNGPDLPYQGAVSYQGAQQQQQQQQPNFPGVAYSGQGAGLAPSGGGWGAPVAQGLPAQTGGGFGDSGFGGGGFAGSSAAPFGDPIIGDPVLGRIEADMASLTQESGPRADVRTGIRDRKGETGLSALKELTGVVALSTTVAGGRIAAKAEAVVLDSGRPTGSGLARFGQNATLEAQGIVNEEVSQLVEAGTQHAAGIAVSLGYESDFLQAEVGTTPLGFDHHKITWRGAISPRFSPYTTAKVWFERKPVADSVVAYAGTRDPVSGRFWGQVMRTGGGLSFSYDREGTGVYGDASYNRYAGVNVRNNSGYQLNVGGYLPLYAGGSSSLAAGINLNYQSFDNNQNFFTFGHGGYFTPQSFFSISFPLRYKYESKRLEARASIAPGYQSYEQDQVVLYPTDRVAQSLLNNLKGENGDVRSYFDSISKTGFALSADGSVYYRVSPRTQIGGDISLNTFGNYDEFKSSFGIKQSLGGN